jgi:hypothetical protein
MRSRSCAFIRHPPTDRPDRANLIASLQKSKSRTTHPFERNRRKTAGARRSIRSCVPSMSWEDPSVRLSAQAVRSDQSKKRLRRRAGLSDRRDGSITGPGFFFRLETRRGRTRAYLSTAAPLNPRQRQEHAFARKCADCIMFRQQFRTPVRRNRTDGNNSRVQAP